MTYRCTKLRHPVSRVLGPRRPGQPLPALGVQRRVPSGVALVGFLQRKEEEAGLRRKSKMPCPEIGKLATGETLPLKLSIRE